MALEGYSPSISTTFLDDRLWLSGWLLQLPGRQSIQIPALAWRFSTYTYDCPLDLRLKQKFEIAVAGLAELIFTTLGSRENS